MVLGGGATAQSPRSALDSMSAPAVAAAFLGAVAAARWREAATFLDLGELESVRKDGARSDRIRRASSQITVRQLMQADPDMSRSVVVYQVKQRAKERRAMNILRFQFGIGDPDSLLSLPIEVVAERWVEVHDDRWQDRGWRMNPLNTPPPRIMQLERTVKGWRVLPRSDLMGPPDMVHACG